MGWLMPRASASSDCESPASSLAILICLAIATLNLALSNRVLNSWSFSCLLIISSRE